MASIVKMDTLIGSTIEVTSLSETAIRGAMVTGITANAGDNSGCLYQCLTAQGMPALRSSHPTRPNLLLQRIRADPISTDQARVQLFYELPIYNGQSAYILTDSSSQQSYTSSFVPGTREPIRIGYDSNLDPGYQPLGGTEDLPPIVIPEDVCNMTFALTRRTVNISQVILGRPSTGPNNGLLTTGQIFGKNGSTQVNGQSKGNFMNYVNDKTWLGLPSGFWQMSGYETRISRFDQYYSVQASAYTLTIQDHSDFKILRQQQTGRYVPVSRSSIDSLAKQPYIYGVQKAAGGGCLRVGPYPTVDFGQLFGFTTD